MAEYYRTPSRPSVATPVTSENEPSITVTVSDFDKHRETLLTNDVDEGWALELCRYLETVQHDIKKDSDIVEWWQVSFSFSKTLLLLI